LAAEKRKSAASRPKRTDFYFVGIVNIPSKLRIATERDDEQSDLYMQVFGGSISSPPTIMSYWELTNE